MYLYGDEFEFQTDHKPIQFIFSPSPKACAPVTRWILRLHSYKYRGVYIMSQIVYPDFLTEQMTIHIMRKQSETSV